jgi:hypothetical protein
VFIIINLN